MSDATSSYYDVTFRNQLVKGENVKRVCLKRFILRKISEPF
jgi:hypothetical protein